MDAVTVGTMQGLSPDVATLLVEIKYVRPESAVVSRVIRLLCSASRADEHNAFQEQCQTRSDIGSMWLCCLSVGYPGLSPCRVWCRLGVFESPPSSPSTLLSQPTGRHSHTHCGACNTPGLIHSCYKQKAKWSFIKASYLFTRYITLLAGILYFIGFFGESRYSHLGALCDRWWVHQE